MFNFFKNKKESVENKEIIVEDSYPQLPDIKKIAIPDLKQYLLNGYEEIRAVKKEKEELEEKLKNSKKYQQLYDGALVTLNEFKKRDEENNKKIKELESKIEEMEQEKQSNFEIYNNLRIELTQLQNEKDNNEKIILNKMDEAVAKAKKKIIENIQNTKGNISKTKVCDMIKKI